VAAKLAATAALLGAPAVPAPGAGRLSCGLTDSFLLFHVRIPLQCCAV